MIIQKQPKGAQQENQNKTRMVNNLIRLNPIRGIKDRKKQAEIHKTPKPRESKPQNYYKAKKFEPAARSKYKKKYKST